MDRVKFKINGVECSVGCEVSSDLTLLDYIRNDKELRGTKYMCREAGCGACIVSVVKCPGDNVSAVNSCMVSITSCQDWEITTIEKVGNKLDGYHPLQTTLTEHNGTQCGYCTPGWIMSMYSLLQSKKDLTMLEIEKSFGSNVCRCTGYRPILDAFKKFAKDAPKPNKLMDIEDLYICKKTGKNCDIKRCDSDEWCMVSEDDVNENLDEQNELKSNIRITLKDGKIWYRVSDLRTLLQILAQEAGDSYMLVAGNTAKGAYPIFEYPRTLIDISRVAELKQCVLDQNLILGAGLTLSELLNIFQKLSTEEDFGYLQKMHEHINLVAHIPVRNIGTLGGNLMIKHQHNEFSSDMFLLLETVGAQLTILHFSGRRQIVTMRQFLRLDMKGSVIVNALLPPLNKSYQLVTYKIMPRSQSAHAIVNAGFLYRIKNDGVVRQSKIVYGGLSPNFVRASNTEKYIFGKNIFTNDVLQNALKVLSNELLVVENPPEPSAGFRKKLALGLFYKGLLSICPADKVHTRYRSGAVNLREARGVSEGRQIFDTNPTLWPLNQPIPKVEALIQCSGEAPYSEDIPTLPREVFAEFVVSTIPKGIVVSMDPSQALAYPGVIAFYTAKDIPGVNSFTPKGSLFYTANEKILSDGEISYHNQPIAIIVAESRVIAERASKLVRVKYSNIEKPVIDIKETKKDKNRVTLNMQIDATDRGNDVARVIKGNNTIYEQYHFCMETLVCVTRPTEEGVEIHPASQYMDGIQIMVSRALKMDENKIDVHVRRLGGAYGFKISRIIRQSVASSLVTMKLNRPCRFIEPLTYNMKAEGKRLPCSSDFEVGVNSSGVVQYMNHEMYEDNGYMINETLTMLGNGLYNNCYDSKRWNYKSYDVTTDTAKNTWCRSPGTLEVIAMAEWIMERISYEMSLDALEVRLANLDNERHGDSIREIVDTVKNSSQYNERRAAVNKFNSENRWKKRGLRFSFLRWEPVGATKLDVNLSVYRDDGTVSIVHGGIEIGQGLNTKAVQICAYILKIPVEKIQIKSNNTIIAPNCFITGGSIASQNVGLGVRRAAEELLRRLKPIRDQMNNPTWEDLIKRAFAENIDLQTHGYVGDTDMFNYDIYGVTLAEVEVDMLTGEFEVIRVDLLEDVGLSVSPEVDVGQVEGAFMMGLGYWTSEHLVYSPQTGEVLTDRTWNYYVPLARDIPQDLRVYFRKKSYSEEAILGAKGVGEPPMCMSVVIPFAIREALSSARLESGIPTTEWFQIDGAYTTEKICMAAATKLEDFKYN